MNTLIIISVLPIVLLYLGLYKANKALLPVTIIGLLAALGFALAEWNYYPGATFSGMFLFDNFSIAFSGVTIISTILILLLSPGYFEKISSHVAEYLSIILFSLAGIIIMVSYHNLCMLFIGIEIMSVSLYILAGIKKTDAGSNEASLKYFLMGAFSTGFLLLGITLLYGATGSFDLNTISTWIGSRPPIGLTVDPLFASGILFLTIGLCFKIGAAPFHFWTPDVYQGSPTLITAFMSTVVKTAGFAAFLRLFSTCFMPLAGYWTPIIYVITVLTLCIGNVTALLQTSFKRMLAFSSISHAGYMLFALITLGVTSQNGIFVYVTAYSVATIVAFAVLILIQQKYGSDSFDTFNGLAKRNPFLALMLTIAMLSLAGIPLTAGFAGKFFMFNSAINRMQLELVVVAIINAVISIYYYFKVIIAMYFKPAADGHNEQLAVPGLYAFVLGLSAVVTLVIGIYPGIILNLL